MKTPLVEDVMTTVLKTVNAEDTAATAEKIFKENNLHHLPVLHNDGLCGILSKSDMDLFKYGQSLFKKKDIKTYQAALLATYLVQDIMTTDPTCIKAKDTLQEAYHIFKNHHFRCLPVISDEGILLGIITPIDLASYYLDH